MSQDRGLDRFGDPVGMWTLGAREPVDEALCPVGLIVAPDLIELLARIAHDPARLGDVAHLVGEFEQAQLAECGPNGTPRSAHVTPLAGTSAPPESRLYQLVEPVGDALGALPKLPDGPVRGIALGQVGGPGMVD